MLGAAFEAQWFGCRASLSARSLLVHHAASPSSFKQMVEKYMQVRSAIGSNPIYLYHGTFNLCSIGDTTDKACTQEGCGVCGIMRHGMRKDKCSPPNHRFGRGIYLSEVSSKAGDYPLRETTPQVQRFRAIIRAEVTPGAIFTATYQAGGGLGGVSQQQLPQEREGGGRGKGSRAWKRFGGFGISRGD